MQKSVLKKRLYDEVSFAVVDTKHGDVYSSYHRSPVEAHNHMEQGYTNNANMVVVAHRGEKILYEVNVKGKKVQSRQKLPATIWSGAVNVHYTSRKF